MTNGDILGLQVVAPGVYSEVNLNTLFAAKSVTREAHASVSANTDTDLTWNNAFANTNYVFTYNGYDSSGNPVEILMKSKTTTKIVIRTLVAATVMAIGYPYGSEL